ncbi:MAG: endopeptidase La [Deltaproteobacteria bacterium]|jgi:ATP-dependent Lon protease|nr:endopeptidase La [Deltaproteobacteria bacterium]
MSNGFSGGGQRLPLMPLREIVLFPHSVLPLFVGRISSIKAVDAAIADYDRKILLVAQRSPDQEKPAPGDLFALGTIAKIIHVLRLPDGTVKVLFEGLHRAHWHVERANTPKITFSIVTTQNTHGEVKPVVTSTARTVNTANNDDNSFFLARIEPLAETEVQTVDGAQLIKSVIEELQEYNKVNKKIPAESLNTIFAINSPGRLADIVMSYLKLEYRLKQDVLEILNPEERLAVVYNYIHNELTTVTLDSAIKTRVKNQMERNQREYYLNEQIKAIHKEMGREDDPQTELADIEKRIKEKDLPEAARERGLSEIKKLRYMSPSAAEYTVVRNYIDWILELPWNIHKETGIDIHNAKEILDKDHYGLEKPKERILEYLAVQKLSHKLKGPILCLVGPPGVGKTSLARSVAGATGRAFVRLSLGGVRDEAEIRGHRRTYVGALPGKIIHSLKRAKFSNPLFCLDEIDKMSSDFRGDPASALLEVLDPEQNNTFNDHYLDLDYDLSKVFFITTANSLHDIPIPLQDRMEIIRLPGYLETDKQHIARGFLLPKEIEANGLKPENLHISDNAITEVIRSYTREAGVRGLEREIAAICRKTAMRLVETDKIDSCVTVGAGSLPKLLGVKKFKYGERENTNQVGVCTGLAYTEFGGDLLMVETAIMPGTGKLNITGKLGDVMTESAKAALSYVRSRSAMLGLRDDFHKDIDIHIHVPDGATPKDGPSAGITLATSMVSALLGLPVRNDIAMTGEITLRGRVLPIGGLREKLLAATRGLIKTVLVPAENEKDLKEVPEAIMRILNIQLVDNVDQVLPKAILGAQNNLFEHINEPVQLYLQLRNSGHDLGNVPHSHGPVQAQ